jgi:hypothetical protein
MDGQGEEPLCVDAAAARVAMWPRSATSNAEHTNQANSKTICYICDVIAEQIASDEDAARDFRSSGSTRRRITAMLAPYL